MRNYIENIFFKKNGEPFNLKLNGKNLIISGNNGSGKTKLIERIFSFINESIKSHNPYTKEQIEIDIKNYKVNLNYTSRGQGNYDHYVSEMDKLTAKLKEFSEFNVTFNDLMDFRVSVKEKNL